MNAGRTINSLAEECERIANSARDFLVPSRQIGLFTSVPDPFAETLPAPTSELRWPNSERYVVNGVAAQQIATHLQIPKGYYDRLQQGFPDLLDQNVNTLLQARDASERRMVRCLDGNARAFLSDRYRRIDNWGILQAVLPDLLDQPWLEFVSAEVTESRLYLKLVSERLKADIDVGDTVRVGVMITNSEVGLGSFGVVPFSERLICRNGAVHQDYGMRKNHVGRVLQQQIEGEPNELFSEETIEADDRAFLLKCRDIVRAALSETLFNKIVADMRRAAGIQVTVPPQAAVEALQRKFSLRDGEKEAALYQLIHARDRSLWTHANALTAVANGVENYDRSTELQAMGGALIGMARHELRELVA